MPHIRTNDLEYAFGETRMRGHFAIASDGPAQRPGILIVHDAFGLDAFYIDVADRLAGMGYAALAIDLWGDRRQFLNGEEEARNSIAALLGDSATWMGRMEAARQALVAQAGVKANGIAAIGYCLGGSTVLEFARLGGDIAAAVSFHGGLDLIGSGWSSGAIKAKLLVCTGAEDPLVPWTTLTAFQDNVHKGDVTWELDIYGGAKHSFTRPDAATRGAPERSRYDPRADQRSWQAMADFLGDAFEN